MLENLIIWLLTAIFWLISNIVSSSLPPPTEFRLDLTKFNLVRGPDGS